MKKPKRISLALKVNIVIMAMILTVSALLILISENTYQKAVFRPYFCKLENAEVPATVKPLLQGFIQYSGQRTWTGPVPRTTGRAVIFRSIIGSKLSPP